VGYSTHDALVLGGHTRLRPILMTAIAIILALVPLAVGFN
jgi:multidrug efflux pump subunit AcrB